MRLTTLESLDSPGFSREKNSNTTWYVVQSAGCWKAASAVCLVLLWGSAKCFWCSSSWSCLIQGEKNTPWKEPSAAESCSQHPESERAKEIMNKILVFPFMWNRAEFQDLNRRSCNLQENVLGGIPLAFPQETYFGWLHPPQTELNYLGFFQPFL